MSQLHCKLGGKWSVPCVGPLPFPDDVLAPGEWSGVARRTSGRFTVTVESAAASATVVLDEATTELVVDAAGPMAQRRQLRRIALEVALRHIDELPHSRTRARRVPRRVGAWSDMQVLAAVTGATWVPSLGRGDPKDWAAVRRAAAAFGRAVGSR